MKKLALTILLVASFIGCGTSEDSNNNNDTYMPMSTTSQTSNSQYDANLIDVYVSDDNKDIYMDLKDIGEWGTYYVGATSSADKFNDNPIEANSLSAQEFMIDCSKEDETNNSIYYYCVRTLNINGYYYTDDTGIGNSLTIYKNVPTYLYLKPLSGNTAYIVGEFNYKNNKVVYSPYEKTQVKNLSNNSLTDS